MQASRIPIRASPVNTKPELSMSFDFNKPDPKAMAFGGVLMGRAMEVEHIRAIATERMSSPLGKDTATGISRLAVAVLLMKVVMTAEMISSINSSSK